MQPTPSYTPVGGLSSHRTDTPSRSGLEYRGHRGSPIRQPGPLSSSRIGFDTLDRNDAPFAGYGTCCCQCTRDPEDSGFCSTRGLVRYGYGLACFLNGTPRPGYRGSCCRGHRPDGVRQASPPVRGHETPRRLAGGGSTSFGSCPATPRSECIFRSSSTCSRSNHLQEPYANDPPKRLQLSRPTRVRVSRFHSYPKCSTGGVHLSTTDPRMT